MQKGLPLRLFSLPKRTVHPNERPLFVRIRKADIRSRVKGDLRVEFSKTGLTSYAGLELLIRYFRATEFNRLLRRHLSGLGLKGDAGFVAMVRLLLGLLVVGGRRVSHVDYLRGDPLVSRFCGLRRLPSGRTLARWLSQFTESMVDRLRRLNAEVVSRVLSCLPVRTLTLDVDGTVLSTGHTVERAFRGFNPHHRKVPSYYPITAYLAETGHILRVKNRSGNVHDGRASLTFLGDLFRQVSVTLGRGYRLRFRMDGAFFNDAVFRLLEGRGASYAIKVPFWRWLDLQGLIHARRRWRRVAGGVDAFEQRVRLDAWDRTLRVVIYRKRVHHRSRKNYQLDLFDPADGYFEYSAVATNLSMDPKGLWYFMCGRGAHEKAIGELKSGLAFASIPTRRYGANSAWQQLVVLAHNLLTNFQIETGARTRSRSRKKTAMYLLRSVGTLRFKLFCRAGEVVRPNGTTILRLQENAEAENLFLRVAGALRKAA